MRKKIALSLLAMILFGCLSIAQSAYVSVVAPAYQKKIDTSEVGKTYIGEAPLKATDDQPSWRIYRILVSGNHTYIQYMNYSAEFNQKWANRSYGDY